MFKFFSFCWSICSLLTPIGSLLTQPIDIDFSIQYLSDDFIRQGYEENIFKIGKNSELKTTYTNNEQQIFIKQGLIATRDLQIFDGYQYHQTNHYGGGESGINIIDTALQPTSEIWDLTKHLTNYDHLSPKEKLISLTAEEQLANVEKKFLQFKMKIDFNFTINNLTYRYSGEFLPRYTYQTGRLTNQESYLFPQPGVSIFNQEYLPKLCFEPTLSVHEQKTYTESKLQGPGIMPRFWITGPYNEEYFQELKLALPRNNQIYATLITRVETMSFFHPVKILDFTHAKQIEINLDFDPIKNRPLLSGEKLYELVQTFVASNFVRPSPIKLYYENLRHLELPFFNHKNKLTTFNFPISFCEEMNTKSNYQQLVGLPVVQLNLYKKINLKEMKLPKEIVYQDESELIPIIRNLLATNFLNDDDVNWQINEQNLVFKGNNAQISNEAQIPLVKVDTEPGPEPKPKPNPDHGDHESEDSNSSNHQVTPQKSAKTNKLKLLWLLLPSILLLFSLLIILHLIKKKKKR